jgi:hypothetical protein
MAKLPDKRQSERIPVNATSRCDFASPVLEDFGPVKIKNVSLEGIGLIVSHNLTPGLLLAINLVNPEKNFAKTMLARIVHATPQSNGAILIGCKFNVPLLYEELSALVM